MGGQWTSSREWHWPPLQLEDESSNDDLEPTPEIRSSAAPAAIPAQQVFPQVAPTTENGASVNGASADRASANGALKAKTNPEDCEKTVEEDCRSLATRATASDDPDRVGQDSPVAPTTPGRDQKIDWRGELEHLDPYDNPVLAANAVLAHYVQGLDERGKKISERDQLGIWSVIAKELEAPGRGRTYLDVAWELVDAHDREVLPRLNAHGSPKAYATFIIRYRSERAQERREAAESHQDAPVPTPVVSVEDLDLVLPTTASEAAPATESPVTQSRDLALLRGILMARDPETKRELEEELAALQASAA